MIRIAILDDYQNSSLKMADWSPLAGRAMITVSVITGGGTGIGLSTAKKLVESSTRLERTRTGNGGLSTGL